MTLDEAIKHAEEVADTCEFEASKYDMTDAYESHVACQEGKCAEEHRQLAEWLKELKRLKGQEPCEDCISRQAVLKGINRVGGKGFETYNDYSQLYDFANALPSVTPEPKVGKWIRVDKDKLRCSECEVIHFIAQYPQSAKINFCPNCGRTMKGERK